MSKKCNRAAIVSTVIADVTNCLHEYPQAYFAKASGLVKLSALLPHTSFFLFAALTCHNMSSSCKKKCDQLEEDIEEQRTKISELEDISKDIRHNEAITKLEKSLQKSKEEIKKNYQKLKISS